jgi:hypothetical protein
LLNDKRFLDKRFKRGLTLKVLDFVENKYPLEKKQESKEEDELKSP